jgi:hypothetical protein
VVELAKTNLLEYPGQLPAQIPFYNPSSNNLILLPLQFSIHVNYAKLNKILGEYCTVEYL